MIRALAWKEWREQRPLVLAGIVLAIVMPFILMAGSSATPRRLDAAETAGSLPALYMFLLWPLLAAATGAGTVANEVSDGTLGFLLSRPASRARVWILKVSMAFFSALLILAASLAYAMLFGMIAGADASGGLGEGLLIVPASLLLFAASVFFSTVLSRAMTAAAAGVAGSTLILAALFLLWSSLDLQPRLEPDWMSLDICLAAGLTLLASLYLFTRGELLRGGGARRRALMAAISVVGGVCLVSVPLVQARNHVAPSSAVLEELVLSPTGDAVATTVTGKDMQSPQVWLIHADGSGIERLAGRLTYSPAFSPDGRRIAYLSSRGPFGLRSSEIELRAMRDDGAEDRRLAAIPGVPWLRFTHRDILFSPDGGRVATLGEGRLVVASLSGGEQASLDLTHTPFLGGALVGWSAQADELLLFSRPYSAPPAQPSTLGAISATTGKLRILFSEPGHAYSVTAIGPRAGWSQVPLLIDREPGRQERDGFELILVDAGSGAVERISRQVSQGSVQISENGEKLGYAVFDHRDGNPAESQIHLRDLRTGQEHRVATLPGKASLILFSPSQDRLVINRSWQGGGTASPVLLTEDGQLGGLPSGWWCIGWHGKDRLIAGRSNQIAVIDIPSGETRPIFP